IPLPMSRITGVTGSPNHSPRVPGSSESVVSVLLIPDLSSGSSASVHNPSNVGSKPVINEAKRVPVVTFNTVERSKMKEVVEVVKLVYPEYIGVVKEKKKKEIRVL
ncbi:guanine nucleotide-binding protein alpha-2 subunit, partial [Trifolium pratense]